MSSYQVCWEIELDAATPRQAAEKALQVQRNHDSLATVFLVMNQDTGSWEKVDLLADNTEDQ